MHKYYIVRLRNIADDHVPLVMEAIDQDSYMETTNCPAGLEIFLIDWSDLDGLDDHMHWR